MHAKSRKAARQCAGQLSYGYADAMPGLRELAMDRRGETARSTVLPVALRDASEAASMRGDLLGDLRGRPTEGMSALLEGESGG